MFYNNLLCFLVAIFVFSASNPPEKPWLPPVAALALLLTSLWLFAGVARRMFAAATSSGRYFSAERRLSFAAVGLFVGLVGLLYLKFYLQPLSIGDRLPVLTDIAGLAAFFLLLAIVWYQGRRRYMQLFHSRYSAGGFVWSNLKANLPAVLPWLILSLVFDLLQLLPYPPLARFLRSPWGELALFGLFVIFLVLFFP
ncbi:MAG: peptidase M48 Ste24p, partial [Desulfobulbus sp.]|nr:peptidase M48 Ste24p [Desulfobulbus sp.]